MNHDRPAERKEPVQSPVDRVDEADPGKPVHIGSTGRGAGRETWRRLLAAWTQPLAVVAD